MALTDYYVIQFTFPIESEWAFDMDSVIKSAVFAPVLDVIDAHKLHGAIGNYEGCLNIAPVTGSFVPDAKAEPAIGQIGKRGIATEVMVQIYSDKKTSADDLKAFLEDLKAAHPYDQPMIAVIDARLYI